MQSTTFDRVLILGGSSAIAVELTRCLVGAGTESVCVIGRNADRIERVRLDIAARGAKVDALVMNSGDAPAAAVAFERAWELHGPFSLVIVAQGSMPDQGRSLADPEVLGELIAVNYEAPAAFIATAAKRLSESGHGTVGIISSVAADRARVANFAYGSTKAALEYYVAGMRARYPALRFVTFKPGPTDTRMLSVLGQKPGLTTPATEVAKGALRALRSKRDVAYLPSWWGGAMFLLRLVPEALFRRLPI